MISVELHEAWTDHILKVRNRQQRFVKLSLRWLIYYYRGGSRGVFVGFGPTPSSSETKKFFEVTLVGRGLNLVRCDGKKTRKRPPQQQYVNRYKYSEW